jgi:uncharacterized protein
MPLRVVAQFFLFFCIFLSLMFGLHWFVGRHLIDTSGLPERLQQILWTFLWVGMGFLVAAPLSSRLIPKHLAKPFMWVGFTWLGSLGFLFVLTLLSSVASIFQPLIPLEQSTLTVARTLLILSIGLVLLIYGFFISNRPRVVRIDVPLPNLPKAFDGFKIVQLSDIHIGETLGFAFSEKLKEMVNALQADAVVITGDMIDSSVHKVGDEVNPLGEMTSVHGTFFVTGNHEYYHGAEAWMARASALKMTVLHNAHVLFSRGNSTLALAGVPDVEGARFSPEHEPNLASALSGKLSSTPVVLLAHQPRFAKTLAVGAVDLMLSGHTHGGQLWPFNFFVKLQQPVVKGLHLINGILTYTSQGTGYWGPPIRIGTRGEITELTLRFVEAVGPSQSVATATT